MKLMKSVQIIEKEGKPEWAVIPYKDFLRVQATIDISREVETFKRKLAQGQEELLPSKYAERLILGETAVRVWREYRGLSQAKLATLIGISIPYLSQIENEERQPSTTVLKKLAVALKTSLDDLA